MDADLIASIDSLLGESIAALSMIALRMEERERLDVSGVIKDSAIRIRGVRKTLREHLPELLGEST